MSALSGKRILLVEDEFLVAEMAADMLADLGAEVVGPAYSLKEALNMAQAGGFDAAMLDVNLNGQRSEPVARLLVSCNVPFIFATGYATDPLDEFCVPVVDKPYGRHQVAEALAKALAAGD